MTCRLAVRRNRRALASHGVVASAHTRTDEYPAVLGAKGRDRGVQVRVSTSHSRAAARLRVENALIVCITETLMLILFLDQYKQITGTVESHKRTRKG